jgi:hypothetical protein
LWRHFSQVNISVSEGAASAGGAGFEAGGSMGAAEGGEGDPSFPAGGLALGAATAPFRVSRNRVLHFRHLVWTPFPGIFAASIWEP